MYNTCQLQWYSTWPELATHQVFNKPPSHISLPSWPLNAMWLEALNFPALWDGGNSCPETDGIRSWPESVPRVTHPLHCRPPITRDYQQPHCFGSTAGGALSWVSSATILPVCVSSVVLQVLWGLQRTEDPVPTLRAKVCLPGPGSDPACQRSLLKTK
jgi:hypothetical protein